MAKKFYVTKKPSVKLFSLYDFARTQEQAVNMLRDLADCKAVAHKSTSEGGEYNIYVRKGTHCYPSYLQGKKSKATTRTGQKIKFDKYGRAIKKKGGAKTTYIDKDGYVDKTYRLERDSEGHFKHFTRIAGLGGVKIEASKFLTLTDLKKANKKAGQFYFSPSTLRYFNSKFLSPLLYGRFFIERSADTIRINYANNDASISSFTEKTFKSKGDALKYLKSYLATGKL